MLHSRKKMEHYQSKGSRRQPGTLELLSRFFVIYLSIRPRNNDIQESCYKNWLSNQPGFALTKMSHILFMKEEGY